MTFLNYAMLFGLIGVAIPIVIHLLNRRRAQLVDWGAMQFLLASLASRNRRILLEEILLMAVRCLAVGLIALAMARPFLPSHGGPPWAAALVALPAVAILGAVGAVMWSRRWVRLAAMAAAAVLAVLAATALARADWLSRQRWASTAGAQDIAIVIDGSMSMTLSSEQQMNFRRAISEARAVVNACRPADTVSLILGGTFPQEIVPTGISDRKELFARLDALAPSEGSLQVLQSLNSAGASLARGHNPGKRIVLITDGQDVGWDLPAQQAAPPGARATALPADGGQKNEERWRWLARSLSVGLLQPPKIVCRFLPTPAEFQNLCVDELAFSRGVVGTDRSVRIDVKVTNTGTAPAGPCQLELLIDGVAVGRQTVGEVAPSASQTLHFPHRFDRPGDRLVTARLVHEDDMPADNSTVRLLKVIDELPVLIIEGTPSAEPGAGTFMRIALSPGGLAGGPATPATATSRDAREQELRNLVAPEVIDAPSVAKLTDLSRYRMVILADVPMLPEALANELGSFVRDGGGLLIVPGDLEGLKGAPQTRFYETWTDTAGKPICPAKLAQKISSLELPVRLADRTFTHPALELAADYVGPVLVNTYWRLEPYEKDPAVRVGGYFDSGHPFLVARAAGKGHVVMIATSLDGRQNNLPRVRACFVPLVHELVYFLASSPATGGNFQSGAEVSIPLPQGLDKSADWVSGAIKVLTPSNERRPARLIEESGRRRLHFAAADAPGVYRFLLPSRSAGARTQPVARDSLMFVVRNQPAESRLTTLDADDLKAVQQHVDLAVAGTTQELTAMVHGGTPGQEVWKGLVLCAVLALLGEIAITRWIARQRRTHAASPVEFGQDVVDIQSFRARARELVEVGSDGPPEGAGRRT